MPYRPLLFLLSAISILFAQNATLVLSPVPQPTQQTPNQEQQQPQQPQKDEPPGTVEGQVVNALTGEPLKKVMLILNPTQQQADATPYSTTSDASGHFAMSNIAPGRYRLTAERTGFVRGDYGSPGPMRPGSTLTLSSGQEMKLNIFKMQPQGVISGRVLDEDGEGIANVQIQAMTHRYIQGKRQLIPTGNASTNDLGEYRLFGLAPGRYILTANYRMQFMGQMAADRTAGARANEPEEGYATTYYPGTTDPSGAMPLTVGAGRSMSNTDIKLMRSRTLRIRGRVLNGSSLPAMRTMLMLASRDDFGFGFYNRNTTSVRGKDGSFEFRGVAPGAYYLITQYVEDNNRFSARVPVDVGNANVDGIEVTLRPGMEIPGTVTIEGDPSGLNLAQLNVFLQTKDFNPMGGGSSARVKDDGTFVLRNISPDTFRAAVFGLNDQVYIKSVRVGPQEAPNGEVVVVDGAPPALTLVLSTAGGQLSGRVSGDKRAPAQGATVVLVPAAEKRDQTQLFKTATTDQNGGFSFKAIAPGSYKLFAWDNVEPGAWQDPEFLAPLETKGKSVSLKENDVSTADLDLLKTEDSQSSTGQSASASP
jgi:hypothetical protein